MKTMKSKIMDKFKQLKWKIRYIIKCLYEISSKKTRRGIDYHVTKLFNPTLARELDKINAEMLAQSNEDTKKAREFLAIGKIIPEFAEQEQANLDKIREELKEIHFTSNDPI